jgi:hypothetical protein
MIVHNCKGVQHYSGGIYAIGKLAQEPLTIVIRPKNLLPSITATGDVVERVGEVNAWRSCHDPNTISSVVTSVKAS